MAPPTVSICIPTYNGARYLKDCLDSALTQTVEDFELLIVDDGSTDETWDLARQYADRDPRITLVRNESHLGLALNWDRCVQSATGEWVKFLFQDDRLEPSCLEHMLAACRHGVDLVVVRRGLIFEEGTPDALKEDYRRHVAEHDLALYCRGRSSLSAQEFSEILSRHPTANCIGEPTATLIRRSAFTRYGRFNEDLINLIDWEYAARIAANTGLGYVDAMLAHFRVHPDSESSRTRVTREYRASVIDPLIVMHELCYARHFGQARKVATRLRPPVDFKARLTEMVRQALRDRGASSAWWPTVQRYPRLARHSAAAYAGLGASKPPAQSVGRSWPRLSSLLPRISRRQPKRLWLDLGDLGVLVDRGGVHPQWQDHGLGLLRTILHAQGVVTDLASTRACVSWYGLSQDLRGYDMLIMNVRSYTFPIARQAARIFKEVNPRGLVLTGGIHASVAPHEMTGVQDFDKICRGPGEDVIVDLVRDPLAFPRVIEGAGPNSMGAWPMIDRTLWPKPASLQLAKVFPWPLEPECGWGPPPVATILTSRVCPWQCAFCNENSYIANMGRRPVSAVIDELNYLDATHGPIGSVVIHDSMFFQNPHWLREWLDAYPRKARRPWPYWAAARADTVRQWPDLFEALVRETNWLTVSIGFESGSDRVLKILNKECTEEDNAFTIELVNRIGDDLERRGQPAPVFWANIMLGIPGETREDAFKTMRMLRSMRRVIPSPSFYAPYPGSALGHQLIAEGKSLMTSDRYHRFASDEKVKGLDYDFYRALLQGAYDAEITGGTSLRG